MGTAVIAPLARLLAKRAAASINQSMGRRRRWRERWRARTTLGALPTTKIFECANDSIPVTIVRIRSRNFHNSRVNETSGEPRPRTGAPIADRG